MTAACHICSCPELEICSIGLDRVRITSDCKPWPAKSVLAICSSCQTVQTAVTTTWRQQISKIYQEYQVYHQAGGVEQAVFNATGEAQSRSSRLVAKLAVTSVLPKSGHVLDIGCGNGSFLSAFGKIFPDWKLFGAEFDNKHASELSSLDNFEKLYTGGIGKIEQRFDFVSMIHTLEHIENPLPFLLAARELLTPCGYIFIQVPHYRENPFELMTYDHASHFDVSTLCRLLHSASLFPIHISTDWVSKEISLLASTSESRRTSADVAGWDVKECLEWMEKLIKRAQTIQANSQSFGIFGSSIAATWTSTNLPHLPDFFVDEDTVRIGKTHLGKKIIHPDSIPDGSDIFLALQPNVQHYILKRYALQDKFSLYDFL
jgi:2-polyprenyl-3-methyl-5-hydroxy-6-metoxy-1,4-benzoquinol methylase